MDKAKLLLVLLAGVFSFSEFGCAAYKFIIDGYMWGVWNYSYSDDEYDFDYSAPEDAQIKKCVLIRMEYQWPEYRLKADTVRVAQVDDDIYLEMFFLKRWNGEPELPVWVKTRIENGRLVFPIGERLMTNSYMRTYADDYYGYYKDPEHVVDEVRLYNVSLVDAYTIKYDWHTVVEGYNRAGIACEYYYSLEYNAEPVEAEVWTEPMLIRNPRSSMLLSPDGTKDSLNRQGMRNELLIQDFIMGNITDKEPETLQSPDVVFHKKSMDEYNRTGVRKGIEVRMDPVTSEGYLLDFTRLFIVYRWPVGQGKHEYKIQPFGQLGYSKSEEGFFGNPFKYSITTRGALDIIGKFLLDDDGHEMPIEPIWTDQQGNVHNEASYIALYVEDCAEEGKLEVMCYYLKKDGTRVETPWVTAVNKIDESGVESVVAAPQIEDGRTYDITGREVKGDVLTPGIYIRNGRKFIVPRR